MKIEKLTALTAAEARQAEKILRSCVHCGLCNATCPTYQLLHNECDGPRGRIYLLKQVLEGQTVSSHTLQHLDRCLTCRACETTCPSGVHYARLLEIGKTQLEQQVARPLLARWQRALLCYFLPYPRRFKVAWYLAQCVKPLLPRYLAKQIPSRQKHMLTSVTSAVANHVMPRTMLLLDGCVQTSLAPNINQATAQVLARFGIQVLTVSGCCGAISQHNSAPKDALAFARRNIDSWLAYLDQGVECIISTASGCGVMVKDYAELLQDDTHYAEKARRISSVTRDLLEVLLAEDLTRLKLKSTVKLAVQSPCSLQHGQKLAGSLERLLTTLGFSLCAVADSHLCCGSAGTYSLLQPTLATQLATNKIQHLERQQPDLIATANIGCLTHLQPYSATPVRHWIEIVAGLLAE